MPVCRAEIDRIYSRLHVSFDHTLGESFYQPLLGGVVADLVQKGIARESRGAIGVFLNGDDGKPFKTRSGDTVGLEALLDEGVARALGVVTAADAERGTGTAADQQRGIAEAVGIGAIKYADLSQNRTTDYVFSFDKMLQLTGNTAAYMQYAVARVEGIFAKGGIDRGQMRRECHGVLLTDPRERTLALKLLRFAETLEDVEADYRPNVLTAYLYDVAGAYSTFYDALSVLKAAGAERASRLALCDLTGQVLRKGLELLGIRMPERM